MLHRPAKQCLSLHLLFPVVVCVLYFVDMLNVQVGLAYRHIMAAESASVDRGIYSFITGSIAGCIPCQAHPVIGRMNKVQLIRNHIWSWDVIGAILGKPGGNAEVIHLRYCRICVELCMENRIYGERAPLWLFQIFLATAGCQCNK